LFVVRYLF